MDLRRLVHLIVLPALILGTAASATAEDGAYSGEWPGWVKMGGKLGQNRELALVDFFVPVHRSADDLWFGDFRGKDAGGPESEMNIGGGYRRVVDERWILGAYGYYDRLRSPHSHYFDQATFGLEALTADLDLRANVYLPSRHKEILSDSYSGAAAVVSGNSLSVASVRNQTFEMALPGFDAEAGVRLPVAGQDVRVYAGGFFYDRS